jgi:hypothetical protein
MQNNKHPDVVPILSVHSYVIGTCCLSNRIKLNVIYIQRKLSSLVIIFYCMVIYFGVLYITLWP